MKQTRAWFDEICASGHPANEFAFAGLANCYRHMAEVRRRPQPAGRLGVAAGAREDLRNGEILARLPSTPSQRCCPSHRPLWFVQRSLPKGVEQELLGLLDAYKAARAASEAAAAAQEREAGGEGAYVTEHREEDVHSGVQQVGADSLPARALCLVEARGGRAAHGQWGLPPALPPTHPKLPAPHHHVFATLQCVAPCSTSSRAATATGRTRRCWLCSTRSSTLWSSSGARLAVLLGPSVLALFAAAAHVPA